MTRTTWRRRSAAVICGLIATGLLLGVSLAGSDRGENTLLVWASDEAHKAPDFLAVIDFDRDSRTYGKVLRTVPLSGASAFGNEPHHVGLSRDGRTMALGGLLSVLRGQDQVFFFDVTASTPAKVHPLGQSARRIDHRRVCSDQQRRLSRDVHGRREWRATRTGSRVQRPNGAGADVARGASRRRIQSARHLDRRSAQPHGHQ